MPAVVTPGTVAQQGIFQDAKLQIIIHLQAFYGHFSVAWQWASAAGLCARRRFGEREKATSAILYEERMWLSLLFVIS